MQNFVEKLPTKNFENRSTIITEVMTVSQVSCFYWDTEHIALQYTKNIMRNSQELGLLSDYHNNIATCNRNIQSTGSKLTSNLAKSVEKNDSTTCMMRHARRGACKGTSLGVLVL